MIGYIILLFNKQVDFWQMMAFTSATFIDISIGLGSGLLAGLLGLLLLKHSIFSNINDFFGKMIQRLNPQWYHILFYSFCAGVGEEILFRGAIQSFIFIFPTAIIFVAIHGYLNPKDWKMSLYGIFLVFVSAGMGYLMKHQSIYAAMAAHFIYDVVMFWSLTRKTTAKA
ncbi:MAG: CPBP family intramembrane glutamic endopeptidase [Chitinophagales bacterium]